MRFQNRSVLFGMILGVFFLVIVGGILATIGSFTPVQPTQISEPTSSALTSSVVAPAATFAITVIIPTLEGVTSYVATLTVTPWMTGVMSTAIDLGTITTDQLHTQVTIPPGIAHIGGGRRH